MIYRANYKRTSNSGFTLVELLVAIAVFMVVMTISLGAVLSILDAGRKAKALKTVLTNLNFAVEVMATEIKFGKTYYCGNPPNTPDTANPHVLTQDCTGAVLPAGSSITFTTSNGVDTIYRLSANGKQIEKSTDYGTTYIAVTSPEVTITSLKFYVFGTAAYLGDLNQPRVQILIRGYAGSKPTLQSVFTLQTTASQRALDR